MPFSILSLDDRVVTDTQVFARSHSTIGTGGFTRVSETRCPLTFTPSLPNSDPAFPDTVVHSGFIVVADMDGVVVIDDYIIKEVVELAEKIDKQDKQIEADLNSGMGMEDSMKKRRAGYKVDA